MPSNPGTKIRILLVEGQTLVQQALASLMAAIEGIQVVGSIGSLADAIDAAATLRPDLVLVSIAGDWAAFSAVEKIKSACPTAKVILLDERSLETNAREALRVQAAGYLTKEQPDHQIENSLRRAARGERVFAPDIAARLVLSADGVRLARDTQASPLSTLTPREIDVLVHLAQGFSVKQCAKALGIGTSTAGNHKSRLMKKLDVHKTVDLTRLAIREGLVPEGRARIAAPHIHQFDQVRHERV